MASDRESECTTESSSVSSARISICPLRVSSQLNSLVTIKQAKTPHCPNWEEILHLI